MCPMPTWLLRRTGKPHSEWQRYRPGKGQRRFLLQGYETSPGRWNSAIDAAWRLPLHKIVVSKWLVDLARDRFGDLNVHYIPNSVDTEQFYAPARGKQDTADGRDALFDASFEGGGCESGGARASQETIRQSYA